MNDLDLYKNLKCYDCGKLFLVSGSAPAVNIRCPFCDSKNWDCPDPFNPLKQTEPKNK